MKRYSQQYTIFLSLFLSSLYLLCFAARSAAEDTPAIKITTQQTEYFEAKVRPLLLAKCTPCHGDKAQQGSLRLDSLSASIKGGNRGAALIPGDPDKSLMCQVINYDGAVKMPPSGKMKPDEIETIRNWIKMGAPWPGAKVSAEAVKAAKSGEYVVSDTQKNFWSFRTIKLPIIPKTRTLKWATSPIDRFILASLEAKGLKPASTADRRTLLRRVTFDLIGLPPTQQELTDFMGDHSPTAFDKVVDRLLASPRYGERWGRHWLDVARYSDTKGYVFVDDPVYHNAYTYRDYVIRAFNEDLPYDQFITQQLAADKIPLGEDKRPLAALAFLNIGRRFLNDPVLINDDRIDVTCRGLMGLTVACARCHNHKFDPIPAKDYYSLYGVFASANEPDPEPAISPRAIADPYEAQQKKIRDFTKQRTDLLLNRMAELRKLVEKTPTALVKDSKAALQQLRPDQLPNDDQLKKLNAYFPKEEYHKLKSLDSSLAELNRTMPAKPDFAMALQDNPTPFEAHVFIRGNPGNPGDAVPRRFLQILSAPDRKPFTLGGGRMELAQAISSRDNPLTARVLVNRVWIAHFGKGLVRTPSDFGFRGELPTHPVLLDYLAFKFMESGWSIKKLHKLILLSSVYQQGSQTNPKAFLKDPENRLLSHQNRQRLDLEALRDSLLAVSGEIDLKMGGPSVDILQTPLSHRRTVYGYIERQNLPGLFRTFDFASPDTSSAQRFQTTVPQQALYMMNSPFVVEQSRALLKHSELASCTDETVKINLLYRILFQRNTNPSELQLGKDFLKRTEGLSISRTAAFDGEKKPPAPATLTAWERYVQALLMTNEFSFVD